MRRFSLDAPFWAFVVFGIISLGVVACVGVGLSASRSAPTSRAEILDTDQIQLAMRN